VQHPAAQPLCGNAVEEDMLFERASRGRRLRANRGSLRKSDQCLRFLCRHQLAKLSELVKVAAHFNANGLVYTAYHYFGRFIHAVVFRRFVFCSMGIAEVVVER
jgi:hypothetical protein